MVDIQTAFKSLLKNLDPTFNDCGLTVTFPKGIKKETPAEEGGGYAVYLKGEDLSIKIYFENDKLYLLSTLKDLEEANEKDFNQLSVYLLELSRQDCDVKDIKSASNDFAETLNKSFGIEIKRTGEKAIAKSAAKKNSSKNSAVTYEPDGLALKICGVYPELKDAMNENIEKYDAFLPEEFFDNFATAKIMESIKNNETQKIKKLVNIFNTFYEEGTKDTQSLIAVTILGKGFLGKEELMERTNELMDEPLRKEVECIVKYLSTASGKRYIKKMENPKPYKSKKLKK